MDWLSGDGNSGSNVNNGDSHGRKSPGLMVPKTNGFREGEEANENEDEVTALPETLGKLDKPRRR